MPQSDSLLTDGEAETPLVTREQAWNFDRHLARVVVEGVDHLRHATKHGPAGYPGDLEHDEWSRILDDIKGGFQDYLDWEFSASLTEPPESFAQAQKLLIERWGDLWD